MLNLRHAQDQGGPHSLRILEKINQPLSLCTASFIREVGCQSSTKPVELMADVTFVAFIDATEFTGGMKARFVSAILLTFAVPP